MSDGLFKARTEENVILREKMPNKSNNHTHITYFIGRHKAEVTQITSISDISYINTFIDLIVPRTFLIFVATHARATSSFI